MPKHYAISDIHGMYEIYTKVNDMLAPGDIVYFLGDAGDRGYAGFRCIKEIYENPQWIYLKGNHEVMMINALKELEEGYMKGSNDYDLWMWNGGAETENGWCKNNNGYDWIYKLEKLPLLKKYTNEKGITFYLSHSGFTLGRESQAENSFVWNRGHFLDYWDEKNFPNTICIHGHTPNKYMAEDLNMAGRLIIYDPENPIALTYCNGHKICIDNGVFYTGRTVLYDLDEMKTIPLEDEFFLRRNGDE